MMLPDESVEEQSVASLPREALAGDRVAVRVEKGNLLGTWLLPRVGGLQA
ncbi:hypothetical protein ACFSC4_20615 [Deinococcus malanensis]